MSTFQNSFLSSDSSSLPGLSRPATRGVTRGTPTPEYTEVTALRCMFMGVFVISKSETCTRTLPGSRVCGARVCISCQSIMYFVYIPRFILFMCVVWQLYNYSHTPTQSPYEHTRTLSDSRPRPGMLACVCVCMRVCVWRVCTSTCALSVIPDPDQVCVLCKDAVHACLRIS